MNTVMMPGLETIPEATSTIEQAPKWSLICLNDDIHPMDLVVLAFIRVGLDQKRAIEKMFEIHQTGSAVIKNGLSKEDAIIDRGLIIETTKGGGRFPGIEVSLIEEI